MADNWNFNERLLVSWKWLLLKMIICRSLETEIKNNQYFCIRDYSVYSTNNFLSPIFSPYIYKVWSMLHHGSVGRVQSKECYFMFTYTSAFFIVFIIFISFFGEASNFHNRILISQKSELVIRSCQWNFMYNLFSYSFSSRGNV